MLLLNFKQSMFFVYILTLSFAMLCHVCNDTELFKMLLYICTEVSLTFIRYLFIDVGWLLEENLHNISMCFNSLLYNYLEYVKIAFKNPC